MTTALESARKIAQERNAAKAAAASTAMDKARRMAISIAIEASEQPTAQDIIETADTLGADVDWFFECVERCRARIQDCENQAKLPGLREQAAELNKNIEALKAKAEAAGNEAEAKLIPLRDVNWHLGGRFFREDITAEQIADLRRSERRETDFTDAIGLAQRDLERVRRDIRECQKIDANNIDPKHPAPHDFVLPPIQGQPSGSAVAPSTTEVDPFSVADGESFPVTD